MTLTSAPVAMSSSLMEFAAAVHHEQMWPCDRHRPRRVELVRVPRDHSDQRAGREVDLDDGWVICVRDEQIATGDHHRRRPVETVL